MFRKKCQSAEEFFKSILNRVESQLWKVDECASDLNNIKIEPFEKTIANSCEEDFAQCSFGFQQDEFPQEAKIVNDESCNEEIIEETIEIKQATRNMGFRRRSNKAKVENKRKKNSSLKCQYCGIVLSRRNRLIQHERLHVLDQTQDFYECFWCGKSFNQKFGKKNL